MSADRLREMPVFGALGDEDVARLAEAGRERRLASGEHLFLQGEHPTAFHVVLEGTLETTREVAGEQVLMMSHGPGGFLGAMALLTDTAYRGSTFAIEETLVFELDGDAFRRLAFEHPPLLRAFLPVLESVSGAIKGIERDREKLLAVGGLAAGLAHELNNPASAAVRGLAVLRDHERRRLDALAELAAAGIDAERLASLASLADEAARGAAPGGTLDALAAGDIEEALVDALERRDIGDGDEIAYALKDAGLGPEWVERVDSAVGADLLAPGLRFLAACAGTQVLLGEVEESTTRISTLVDAVRSYSYLDQGARQTVDVHAGLESSLALLAGKLRGRPIEVVRDFDPELPTLEASGSELNQVWTNVIDNAVDALAEGGRITLRTRRQAGRICVEIADDGPGVPAELRGRIFEAFFTTKPVGQGAGLGLDIAQRIVVRHHGELRLESQPGDTRFQVLLPLASAGTGTR